MAKYDDGQEVKVGDVIKTPRAIEHGWKGRTVVVQISGDDIKYQTGSGVHWAHLAGIKLVERAKSYNDGMVTGFPPCGTGDISEVLEVAAKYRKLAIAKQKEQTMKKAYKAYIIEQDNDGNQIKMLHESIVFAVSKDKAEQAMVIKATKGGVVDEKTNFVVVANPIVY